MAKKTDYGREVQRLIEKQNTPVAATRPPRPQSQSITPPSSRGQGANTRTFYGTSVHSGVVPDDLPEGFNLVEAANLTNALAFNDLTVDIPDNGLQMLIFQCPAFKTLKWGVITCTLRMRVITTNGRIECEASLQRQQAPVGGANDPHIPGQIAVIPITSTAPEGADYVATLTYDDIDANPRALTDRLQLFLQFRFEAHESVGSAAVSIGVNVRPGVPNGGQHHGVELSGNIPT